MPAAQSDIILIITSHQGVERRIELPAASSHTIALQDGDKYRLINPATRQAIADVTALREGDDLALQLAQGQRLVLPQYFSPGAWSYSKPSFDQDIGSWTVSAITTMHNMLANASNFNQNTAGWDVSAVTNMWNMFGGAKAFNQAIGDWDVSAVLNMQSMFLSASAFNQDIGNWDVSSVLNMRSMFFGATAFNQDIGAWDVSAVTDMSNMFAEAEAFNQDIGNWDVSAVTDMSNMFAGAEAFNQDIGNWDVSAVTTMSGMFAKLAGGERPVFDQDIGAWDVSAVTNMEKMFEQSGLSQVNYDNLLSGWSDIDTSRGEQGLQNDVKFGAATTRYSDATARQYLIDTWGWIINDAGLAGGIDVGGNDHVTDILGSSSRTDAQIIHGLGGDDKIKGGSADDLLVGGAGNDILAGNGGSDTFRYSYTNAGADTIKDFEFGYGNDVLDLSVLLDGYGFEGYGLFASDFITLAADANDKLQLIIDHDGKKESTAPEVIITLANIDFAAATHTDDWLDDLVKDGNLVLGKTKVTVGDDVDNELDLSGETKEQIIHGLGGADTIDGGSADDIITGGAGDDIITGGAGDDTLTGHGGSDTFKYSYTNAGADTITDFEFGNPDDATVDKDIIDLSSLVEGYGVEGYGTSVSDFITLAADARDTDGKLQLIIDHDGKKESTAPEVTITLANMRFDEDSNQVYPADAIDSGAASISANDWLANIIDNGNLVLG